MSKPSRSVIGGGGSFPRAIARRYSMPLRFAPARAETSGSSHVTVRVRAAVVEATESTICSISNSVSSDLLLEHDLCRKPVPTFRDHALGVIDMGMRV